MELWERFSSVVSSEKVTGQGCSGHVASSSLVAYAETYPLKKLLIWCLRVFSTGHFCRSALFNECEQNLSADTNTWISIQKLEKILHPMKRTWPVMQHVWDLHQVQFTGHKVYTFSKTNESIVLLIYVSVLLQVCCTVLVWFSPCVYWQWLCLPVMLVMLPHEKDMNWSWHNPSVWSFEPETAPTQKNLFVPVDIAW